MKTRKNYFSEEEQKIMKTKYSRDEMKENPNSLEGMMMGFQGRPLHYSEDRDFEAQFPTPTLANPFGVAKVVYYDSDKRDPASPYGEGKQGVMKRFVHEHDKRPVLLYEITSRTSHRPSMSTTEFNKHKKKHACYELPSEWPEKCAWIGKLVSIEYETPSGLAQETFDRFDLYVWEDTKTLMAVPSFGSIYQILLWRGPDMKVNWRGIIH